MKRMDVSVRERERERERDHGVVVAVTAREDLIAAGGTNFASSLIVLASKRGPTKAMHICIYKQHRMEENEGEEVAEKVFAFVFVNVKLD